MALLIVLVSGVVTFVVWQRMEDSVEQTMQAAGIQLRLDAVYSLLQDAEGAQCDFLLTDQPSVLARYHSAVDELPGQLAQLEALLKPGGGANPDFGEGRKASVARLEELGRAIELHRGGQREKAVAIIASKTMATSNS